MATSDVRDIPQSSAIEPPPNFPVVWERPDDAQLFWNREQMHFPDPVTPLTEDAWAVCLNGFNRTWAVYDLGLRLIGRRINSYHYEAIAGVWCFCGNGLSSDATASCGVITCPTAQALANACAPSCARAAATQRS